MIVEKPMLRSNCLLTLMPARTHYLHLRSFPRQRESSTVRLMLSAVIAGREARSAVFAPEDPAIHMGVR
jgi:hypothetical protein